MINKIKKEENGITLIALVITIVVLLILAGVAISMLSGENGILKKAAEAKTKTDQASMEENIHLAYLASLTAGNGNVDYPTLNEELGKIGFNRGEQNESDGTYPNDITGLPAMIEINEETYTITKDGKSGKAGTWMYKKDSEGRKTIVTNGVLELKIGDYINYNAAATDANEKDIKEETVTSNAGSPTTTSSYTATSQTITEGNGASNQTFSNKAETNGWRVLGIDEETGEILIISADPVKTTANENFNLRGIAGYQYGEQELDKVCSVYKNGYGATGARSVDLEDVNNITGYNPNNTGEYDPEQTVTEGGKKYGYSATTPNLYEYENKVTYTWNTTTSGNVDYSGTNGAKGTLGNSHSSYGFNWYDITEKKWNSNTSLTGEITTLTSNYYYYYPNSLGISTTAGKGLDTTSPEYATLFCNKSGSNVSYWLASPYVNTSASYASFGISIVDSVKHVNIYSLYHSYGFVRNRSNGVRPVVSLKSDIKLQYDSGNTRYDIIG